MSFIWDELSALRGGQEIKLFGFGTKSLSMSMLFSDCCREGEDEM
jgi:hypothetical protein